MRVSFEHKEISRGLLKKKIYVKVITTVQFSDGEIDIIKSKKLKDFVILEREPGAIAIEDMKQDQLDRLRDAFHLRIRDVMSSKPDEYVCLTAVHARNYEHEVTEKLKELKNFIAGSAMVSESKTIEI